jgi:crotonobetainyl-CoA:carnitine CoA-transferase CaiB-like acyl-CoA transferase
MRLEEFAEVVRVAGLEPPQSEIIIEGVDPILRSPMCLGAGMAAAHGMVASSIDDIYHQRTGKRQRITIDLAHSAVGASSMWLLRVDGERAVERYPVPSSPTDGAFQCADDRWIYMLSIFPRLADGTLDILECESDRPSVTQAIAQWDSAELETALTERHLTGTVLRTHEEWLEHPQGRILRDVPVVELERIDDAPPILLPDGERPLTGLRVLDTTRVLAGPTLSRTLAEFGADVLQIGTPQVPDLVAAQADTGHGKRRAYLNLANAEDEDRLRPLLSTADVFSQSDRAGAMASKGLGPKEVADIKPGIIYVSVNCFGHVGPWKSKRGFDPNAQAAVGIYSLHQSPGEAFSLGGVPMAMNDYATGAWGAYGVLQALQRRAKEGGSWHVKVSLCQTANWFMRMGTPHAAASGLGDEDLVALADQFMETHDSPYGRLRRLRPVIQMSETPSFWEGDTGLPGSHDPTWT